MGEVLHGSQLLEAKRDAMKEDKMKQRTLFAGVQVHKFGAALHWH